MSKERDYKQNPIPATFEADYEVPCEVCGSTPTVIICFMNGEVSHAGMCGVCTFGESACIDPDNW